MVIIGAFPAAKLGVLFIKQISKPIANLIKTRAKSSPFFSTYVCMPPAQFYNWCEVKTKMWALNLGKPTNVPQLTEAMAIELGANLLGEFIIFTVGAGILLLEYQRQTRKEALKESMIIQEKLELHATLNELAFQVERQDTQIREMSRLLAEIDSKSWTPKIIGDLVGRKKIQGECKDYQDNPLELLPEKRSVRLAQQNTQNLSATVANSSENVSSNSAQQQESTISEEINSNIIYKSLNYLFVEKQR